MNWEKRQKNLYFFGGKVRKLLLFNGFCFFCIFADSPMMS